MDAGIEHDRRQHLRFRNAAGALHPAPRRRCADPRPSAVGMVRPCADDGRGNGAGQYRPRSARPGARALRLRRRKVEGKGRDEDEFAYLRDAPQYRNLLLVEQPNGDFARPSCGNFFTRPMPRRSGGRWRAPATQRWPAIAARPGIRRPTICATLANGSFVSATAPRKATAARRRPSTICGPTPAKCSRSDQTEGALMMPGSPPIRLIRAAMAQDRIRVLDEATFARPANDWMQTGRPQRPAQRASRPSPQRTAIDAAHVSGGDMVAGSPQ